MADFSAQQLVPDDLGFAEATSADVLAEQLIADDLGHLFATAGDVPADDRGEGIGEVSVTTYFKMRALADPGPGYVTWVVADTPDFAGTFAPAPIFVGTVVVADTWSV